MLLSNFSGFAKLGAHRYMTIYLILWRFLTRASYRSHIVTLARFMDAVSVLKYEDDIADLWCTFCFLKISHDSCLFDPEAGRRVGVGGRVVVAQTLEGPFSAVFWNQRLINFYQIYDSCRQCAFFGRALFILSSTKKQTHAFWNPP